jgi:hypothetical protein
VRTLPDCLRGPVSSNFLLFKLWMIELWFRVLFKRHQIFHTVGDPLLCHRCSQRFPNGRDFYIHIMDQQCHPPSWDMPKNAQFLLNLFNFS